MDNQLTVAELSKLAGPKTEAVMASITNIGKRAKGAVDDAVGNVTNRNVNAAKENLKKSKRIHKNIKANKGTTQEKARKKKMKATAKGKVDEATVGVETAKGKQRKARIAAGVTAAVGLAGLAKALKRGSKSSIPALGKKDKLIAGLKKNKKNIAIGAGGAAGAAGLASMLKS